MSKTKITLIGIGNRIVGDDGIALYLLETIKAKLAGDINIQLWENKDALSIAAEILEIHTPIVIVDCADMGLKAGEFRWFKESDCHLGKQLDSVSTHGIGFADALALAQTLGFKQSLFFFAIQPLQLNFNEGISAALLSRKLLMSNALLQHLQELKQQLISRSVGDKC